MAPFATPWSKWIDVAVDVGVGVYAGHGHVAAKWQPATPAAHFQPDVSALAHWGGGGVGPGTDPDLIVWQDVACDATDLSTFRGSTRWAETFGVGTASFTLRNESGRYSTQLDHPHEAVPLRIGRRVRISMRAAGAADWQRVFYGQIIEMDEEVAPDGTDTVTVYVADWASYLARILTGSYPTPTSPAGTVATVMTYWLDLAEWPQNMRNLASGGPTLVTTAEPKATILDELDRLARSGGGVVYTHEHGTLMYRAADWLTDPRSVTRQGLLWASPKPPPAPAPDPVLCPYAVTFDNTRDRVVNRVTFTTEDQGHGHGHGGTATRQDDPSITAHGFIDHTERDVLTEHQTDLDTLATTMLNRLATARRRVTAASVTAKSVADAGWMAQTRIGDRIGVHYEQPGSGWGADTEAHVFGLEWRIDRSRADLTIHTDDAIGATP